MPWTTMTGIVVEDNPDARLLVIEELAESGLGAVVPYASGTALLRAVAAQPIVADFVLLDLHLPDGDGLALCRRLAAVPCLAGALRLAYTAGTYAPAAIQAAGCDGLISKTTHIRDLVPQIQARLAVADPPSSARRAVVREQLRFLVHTLPERLATMRRCLQRATTTPAFARRTLAALAHQVAGESGMLGCSDVTNLASALETQAAVAALDELSRTLDQLVAAGQTAYQALGVAADVPPEEAG